MRINQFEFLLALKRYGSFSQAAPRLFISQPSMSRAIKELEDELGFPIIHRDRTGITFTAVGQQVLAEAEQIMDCVERLRAMADTDSGSMTGELNVSCLSFLCSSILMESLAALHRCAPAIRICSRRSPLEELVDQTASGELDLAVIHIGSMERQRMDEVLEERGLSFHALLTDEGCFLMNAGHPLAKNRYITLRQASKYSLVLVKGDNAAYLLDLFQSHGYPVSPVYIDDTEYTQFIRYSSAVSPCSVYAAQRLCSASKGSTTWRTCEDFKWYSQIGWIQRNEELTPAQSMLVRNLKLCSAAYQDWKFID